MGQRFLSKSLGLWTVVSCLGPCVWCLVFFGVWCLLVFFGVFWCLVPTAQLVERGGCDLGGREILCGSSG